MAKRMMLDKVANITVSKVVQTTPSAKVHGRLPIVTQEGL